MDSPAAPSTACQHAILDLLVTKLNHAQFEALFAGLDWRRVRAIAAKAPEAVE